jgi:hypothetical protein
LLERRSPPISYTIFLFKLFTQTIVHTH